MCKAQALVSRHAGYKPQRPKPFLIQRGKAGEEKGLHLFRVRSDRQGERNDRMEPT